MDERMRGVINSDGELFVFRKGGLTAQFCPVQTKTHEVDGKVEPLYIGCDHYCPLFCESVTDGVHEVCCCEKCVIEIVQDDREEEKDADDKDIGNQS